MVNWRQGQFQPLNWALGYKAGFAHHQYLKSFPIFKMIMHFVYYYYLMQEGHRNTITYDQNQNSQTNCECVFLLRRISENSQSIQIRADFSPFFKAQQTSPAGHPQCFSALPAFNRDAKFFTPSFMLEEDKARLQENIIQCEASHWRKVEQFVQEKEELLVPKPSKANRFCLICKENYDDYLTHISYPIHKRLLKQSTFYSDIADLCQKFNPEKNVKFNKKISKQRKKKQSCKVSQKTKKSSVQKSSQALSTGLQSSQEGQLYVSIK